MRKLTKAEVELSKKAIERLEWNLGYLKYRVGVGQMNLEQGLKYEYESRLNQQKQQLNKDTEDLKITEQELKNLRHQIKYGVPKKLPQPEIAVEN